MVGDRQGWVARGCRDWRRITNRTRWKIKDGRTNAGLPNSLPCVPLESLGLEGLQNQVLVLRQADLLLAEHGIQAHEEAEVAAGAPSITTSGLDRMLHVADNAGSTAVLGRGAGVLR